MDIAAVDAFWADRKVLRGDPPQWKSGSRSDEYEAIWNVEDSAGIISAHLRLKCPKHYRASPSVSLILRGAPICRVDLLGQEVQKLNPPDAADYGLPPFVDGSHAHLWPDNRDYVARNGKFGQMPYRRPIPTQIRKIEQAMLWLSEAISLIVEPHQRGFDVPSQFEMTLVT